MNERPEQDEFDDEDALDSDDNLDDVFRDIDQSRRRSAAPKGEIRLGAVWNVCGKKNIPPN